MASVRADPRSPDGTWPVSKVAGTLLSSQLPRDRLPAPASPASRRAATAGTPPPAPPSPCPAQQAPSSPPCTTPAFRQFHFWLGEWVVQGRTGGRGGNDPRHRNSMRGRHSRGDGQVLAVPAVTRSTSTTRLRDGGGASRGWPTRGCRRRGQPWAPSSDNGASWQTCFDGTSGRRGCPPPPVGGAQVPRRAPPVPSPVSRSALLQDHREPLPHADAHGAERVVLPRPLQLARRGERQACPRHA